MTDPPRHGGGALPKILIGVAALFLCLLIVVWIVSEQANPVILDEKGNVRRSSVELVRTVRA